MHIVLYSNLRSLVGHPLQQMRHRLSIAAKSSLCLEDIEVQLQDAETRSSSSIFSMPTRKTFKDLETRCFDRLMCIIE